MVYCPRKKAVVKRIEQLPAEEQERPPRQVEDALDNAQWHALLADPRSGPSLDALIAREAVSQTTVAARGRSGLKG